VRTAPAPRPRSNKRDRPDFADAPGTPRSTPIAVATLMKRARPLLLDALAERGTLVRQIGALAESVRLGNAALVVGTAGRIGRAGVRRFKDTRDQVEGLGGPPACAAYLRLLSRWLGEFVGCCDALIDVGVTGNLGRLGEAQRRLDRARALAPDVNLEYARLVADLRRHVDAASRRRNRLVVLDRRPGLLADVSWALARTA
jgi:hypothetical protein